MRSLILSKKNNYINSFEEKYRRVKSGRRKYSRGISTLLEPIKQKKEQAKDDFSSFTTRIEQILYIYVVFLFILIEVNKTLLRILTIIQHHKYINHYCMHRRKRERMELSMEHIIIVLNFQ